MERSARPLTWLLALVAAALAGIALAWWLAPDGIVFDPPESSAELPPPEPAPAESA